MGALDDGYSLSEDSIHQLRDDHNLLSSMVRTAGGRRQVLYPPQRLGGGGGNNCTNIRFQILVADAVTRTALCVILSRPTGCNVADIPNTVSDGYAIEVCDPAGCFLNDPEEVLVGRDGWAHYMTPIPGSTWCQDGTYELQPEWQVYSLCCRVDACFL